MKNYVIGIAGQKHSGKDTIASMINYVFAVGISRASYSDYLIRKASIEYTYKDRIVHFADGLKDVLSIIYNIPREYFDNHIYKDKKYYDIVSNKFVDEDIVNSIRNNCHVICLNELLGFNLNYVLSNAKEKKIYIKLRTLMQYFGTNICRTMLSDNIWIKQTMSKIVDISQSKRVCIVPDVRYLNEKNAIRMINDSFYGVLIKVNRKSCDKDEHSSESINFTTDYEIDNNGTLVQLFYKVLEICQNII